MRSAVARGSGMTFCRPDRFVSGDGFHFIFLKSGFGFCPVRVFVRSGVGVCSKLGLLSARQAGTECNQTFAII